MQKMEKQSKGRKQGHREDEEGKSEQEAKSKSRRKRRRPTNTLQEYSRRMQKHEWLETHLWHAKRMHMINIWKFRLVMSIFL